MADLQAARGRKDLRDLRNTAAGRRSWASYVIWGSLAVGTVFAAALTIALVVSAHRGIPVFASAKRPPPPPAPLVVQPSRPFGEQEFARINEALRALAAERDRLVARIEELERSIGDITASIGRQRSATTASPPPPGAAMAGGARPEAENAWADSAGNGAERVAAAAPPRVTGAAAQVAPAPAAEPLQPVAAAAPPIRPPSPVQAPLQIQAIARSGDPMTRTEFAVELGTEATLDGARALWANLRGNHGAALEGLRPLVSIREGATPGVTEFRLIAGPIANAGAAARICAVLQAKGMACQTTVFDGQRLALN